VNSKNPECNGRGFLNIGPTISPSKSSSAKGKDDEMLDLDFEPEGVFCSSWVKQKEKNLGNNYS